MSKKSVTFKESLETVYSTYSADEYDRSRYASIPITSFTFKPIHTTTQRQDIVNNTTRPAIKPLDLSIIPNSRRRALNSPQLSTPTKSTCKKPKLSIDTQSLTPLFFSGLSTHYKNEDEDGYLIPVSAAC